ncbi:FG-GAP repeat protein [Streptomyces gobiensis]|uniref:FG-GAP repeat protein n=1 Tax=Streptomyces gobiensis TaxID=2875706 RepID=UPI001E5B6974|nr:VCBS repeat-containing protein [Streptomyces gobiensis]UGY94233.1 FG-GAP-like repeat-containing protein [Streptomyces gobiensis]
MSGPSTANAASGCDGGTESDFNGDGIRDIAIADPEAIVSGQAEAGLVRIVYGGGKGTDEIHQDSPGVPGIPEKGDRFAYALAATDWNQDGCGDLVVGNPYEGIGDEDDSGSVQIIYGAPGGLGAGASALDLHQGKGSGSIASAAPEADDWFGYSLAAGKTTSGEPYLIIGVPGEDLGSIQDAGGIHYLRGSVNVAVNQDSPGVAGIVEPNDRFGYAVAASPNHIAIGAPGEGIGAEEFSGATQLLSHKANSDGIPTPLKGTDQDTSGINGLAEAGDQYGASLSVVPYRPSGVASASHSLVAIGVPGEGIETGENAGRVVVLEITASGTVQQVNDIHANIAGVAGLAEGGDHFGQHVTAVNTAPGSVGTANTLLLAVGIPGEDLGTVQDTGSAQVFSLLGAPGDSDVWIEKGMRGLPGEYGPHEYVGTSLLATPGQLYVAVPYGAADDHGVYGLPWQNVISDGNEAVTSWKPGEGGLPTTRIAFGAAVR